MINLILLDPTIVIRTTPIPPVIWYERNGIIFQDLKYDRFDEAIEFLIENYIPFDTLCRSIDLINHKDWLDEICEAIRFLLKNDCSIFAVEQATNKIVGIVVMTIMRQEHRSWLFWNFLVNRSEITRKIFGFQCSVMLEHFDRNPNAIVDVSLHIPIVSIARCMKGKLFKEEIILQGAKTARSVGANSISYIATSNNDIERARRVGFKVSEKSQTLGIIHKFSLHFLTLPPPCQHIFPVPSNMHNERRQIDLWMECALKTYNTYLDENGNSLLSNLPAGENFSIIFINCVGPKANTSNGDWILYS